MPNDAGVNPGGAYAKLIRLDGLATDSATVEKGKPIWCGVHGGLKATGSTCELGANK
jgi:hypothetical protein